ncbi:MAG: M28 family peptidase [Ignavibacteria bacterium]|nr:M28 family peptidase [Ignavibacteria bacterium]
MKRKFILIFYFIFLTNQLSFSQLSDWKDILTFSYFQNRGYFLLQRICDEAGGRLAGSFENEKALKILIEEGLKDNLKIRFEEFNFPGWVRGSDSVILVKPFFKFFRFVALGFNTISNTIEAPVVFANFGYEDDYKGIDVKGKIVLVTQERPKNREELLRYEAIEIASEKGAKAILFMNDKPGGLVLAGVGNFQGNPNPIPAFSITYEDGQLLKRLLIRNIEPIIKVKSNSYCIETNSKNAILTIPGKTSKKIVVGGHFDSWDISQGGVDNGVGIAVLYEIARNLSRFKNNYYTIEIVWFNAEELGLWGSKRYVEKHKDEVVLMVNLDMPGDPTGFNIMGFNSLDSITRAIVNSLDGFNLKDGIVNRPWTNSDHMYFMFEGIPSITPLGWMEEYMYHHYHDFGDTFDKVNKKYISNSSGIISLLVYELANSKVNFPRLSRNDVIELLKKNGLENRLRKQKEWKFD